MFKALEARTALAARMRAAEKTAALAGQLRAILPPGVTVEAGDGGVTVSGRGLQQRFVLDASLRWTIAGLLK